MTHQAHKATWLQTKWRCAYEGVLIAPCHEIPHARISKNFMVFLLIMSTMQSETKNLHDLFYVFSKCAMAFLL